MLGKGNFTGPSCPLSRRLSLCCNGWVADWAEWPQHHIEFRVGLAGSVRITLKLSPWLDHLLCWRINGMDFFITVPWEKRTGKTWSSWRKCETLGLDFSCGEQTSWLGHPVFHTPNFNREDPVGKSRPTICETSTIVITSGKIGFLTCETSAVSSWPVEESGSRLGFVQFQGVNPTIKYPTVN